MADNKKQEIEYDENGEPIFNPEVKWISVKEIAEMYGLSEEEANKLKEMRDKLKSN